MMRCLILAGAFVASTFAAQNQKFGSATLTWYGFPNCQTQGNNSNNTGGPFQSSTNVVPGVCNQLDANVNTQGSYVVNCGTSGNDNQAGSIFFCGDQACRQGCTPFPFSGNSDQCYNNVANNGANSFKVKCNAPEATGGGSGAGSIAMGLGSLLAAGAAVLAL